MLLVGDPEGLTVASSGGFKSGLSSGGASLMESLLLRWCSDCFGWEVLLSFSSSAPGVPKIALLKARIAKT